MPSPLRRSAVLVILVLLAGCGAAPSPTPGPAAAVPVVVVLASSATVAETITAVGTVQAGDEVELSPRADGPVVAVQLRPGQPVAAGAILIELAHGAEDAALAEADVAVAQADLDVGRLAPLVARGVADTGTLDQAHTTLAGAQARQAAAQVRRDDRILRAPFAGRIGLSLVATGAWLRAGTGVATLLADGPMRVVFAVPEDRAGALRPGQALRVLAGSASVAGTVTAVDARIDAATRQLGVYGRIAEQALPAGSAVRVEVVVAERRAVLVPEEALVLQGSLAQVWIVASTATGAVARPQRVLPGRREPGRIEIRSGLDAGVPVVVRGLQALRPGLAVSATTVLPAAGR